ncbi:MAG: M48 family metalloprotease [Bacteroidales bacterium]|nr:M48 family metalloprotease [Bacteroidales bacterium]
MKKKYLVLLSFLMCVTLKAGAQKNEHQTLRSGGDLPKDFLTFSIENYDKAAEKQILDSDRRKTTKYKESFLTKSHWYLNRMLRGGSIMFNDPITKYVQDVADFVLKDYPGIRANLRFYTAKHASVNAFSTDAGIIIFNTGLIAQLENEAQLAFVIAHEVVHYYNKHGITGYLEEKLIGEEYKDLDSWTFNEMFYLAKNQRSREMEMEADELGFEKFYTKTEYSPKAALGVMDVLQYAYLPFNEIKFSPGFLTNQYFSIPDKFMLDELKPISVGDDYNDKRSSHPSVRKRRENLKDMIGLEGDKNEKRDFIISEKRFYETRKLARYETIRKHMINRDYPRALYDAYVMMQQDPDDDYLKKITAGTLYGLSIYKSNHTDGPVVSDYEDIEGESQQVYYMMDEMSDEWANVIAMQYAWRLYKNDPDDRYLAEITEHLMVNMIQQEKLHLDGFYDVSKEVLANLIDSTEKETDNKQLSKYDRIRKKNKEQQLKRGEEEYRFALVDMVNDKDFLDAFEQAEEYVKELEEEETYSYDDLDEIYGDNDARGKDRKADIPGVDRVFMIDPMYLYINEKDDEIIQYFKTEKKQQQMSESIVKSSNDLKLEAIMMDPWTLQKEEVDRYNDIVLLKDWMTEYFAHSDIHIIPFASNDVYPLMEDYDTKYLNWMGTISGRVKDGSKFITGCLYLYIGLVPLAIYEWVKPNYQMILFNTLIDLEEADIRFSYRYATDNNAGKYRLQARIYDILNQIKNQE